MQFLGTAAADTMPDPFCDCPICEDARRHPEHARCRSMFLLDPGHMVDFGPDLYAACRRQGVRLTALDHVLITHTHADHLCFTNLDLLDMSRSRKDRPLHLHMSEPAYRTVMTRLEVMREHFPYEGTLSLLDKGMLKLHALPFGEVATVGDYKVLPVPGWHFVGEEQAANYRITAPDGRSLLYALDTGIYRDETFDMLAGSEVDRLIMEATFGSFDEDMGHHLTARTFVEMLRRMLAAKIIREDTEVYATHINHIQDDTHDALQARFDKLAPLPVTVAYDGLEI